MTDEHEDLVFLDFEASSLSEDSWPIEVGLSSLVRDGGNYVVKTWDSLIRPDPRWLESAWSPISAQVHGIARATLNTAPPAAEVAEEVRSRVHGKIVIVDSVPFDGHWLNQLFWAGSGRARLSLNDLNRSASLAFKEDGAALDQLHETLRRIYVPHRAGPDSARLAKAWAAAIKARDLGTPRP